MKTDLYYTLAWSPLFERLVDFASDFIDSGVVNALAKTYNEGHVIQTRFLHSYLPEDLQNFFGLQVEHLQIFGAQPGALGRYHKDGLDRKAALNVPLRGGNKGKVDWTSYPLEEVKVANDYTRIRVNTLEDRRSDFRLDSDILDSLELTQPAVLNTDEWHRVDARDCTEYRFVASVRFLGNPSFTEICSRIG